MKRLKLIKQLFLHTLIISTGLWAQSVPTMNDLEAQVGKVRMDVALELEYEMAILEKALQSEDTTSFGDSFNNESGIGEKNIILQMERLAGLLVRTMRLRNLNVVDTLSYKSTFDFIIKAPRIKTNNGTIKVQGMLEFLFLKIPQITGRDTTYQSFSKPFRLTYHTKKGRWKVKGHQGVVDFFMDSMAFIQINLKSKTLQEKLIKERLKFEVLRTGYPKLAHIENLEELK